MAPAITSQVTTGTQSTTIKPPANLSSLHMLPNNKYALNNKGLALDSLDNHTQAIQYFDKALAIES